MKKIQKTLMAAAAAVVTGGAATAEFTAVDPIEKSFEFQGQTTTLTIHPEFAISGADGAVDVAVNAVIDAKDLQGDLINLMNNRWKFEDCGERFTTTGAAVRPAAEGMLFVGATAQAQKWECGGTKIPKTYCKDTWIKLPFGGKTKGIPSCTVKMEYEGWKTKLISQSIRVEALARPVIIGDTIAAEVTVTNAMPSGLAKHLVNAFGLHGKIKSLIQSRVDEKVSEAKFGLPEEFRAYNVTIHSVDFVDLGSGNLGLKLQATGSITQDQLSKLINGQIADIN